MADPLPSDSPTRRKVLTILAVTVVAVLTMVLLANIFASLVSGDSAAPPPGQSVTVTVTPGSSATTVYRLLADANVVAYAEIESATTEAEAESKLQPGTYQFVTGMSAGEVLRLLLEGGTVADSRAITVVEGWTVRRILRQLAETTEFTEGEYVEALDSGAVTSALLPQSQSLTVYERWEGLFYPARYEIPLGMGPAAILQVMADEMVVRFEAADWSGLADLNLTRYEILVLASLVEREAGTDADRPLISSVIHNRLGVPMRLQIDATVIYALGDNPGRVLADDLEVDSPYNTYRNDGLPPTPIGTVSEASLLAALRPTETEFLFYVLTDTDGSHAFATTYEEHQRNVEDAKERGVLP